MTFETGSREIYEKILENLKEDRKHAIFCYKLNQEENWDLIDEYEAFNDLDDLNTEFTCPNCNDPLKIDDITGNYICPECDFRLDD